MKPGEWLMCWRTGLLYEETLNKLENGLTGQSCSQDKKTPCNGIGWGLTNEITALQKGTCGSQ